MENPRHDLPTLHRPVTDEDNTRIDRHGDLAREVRALPTPPHKRPSSYTQRPYSSLSYSYNSSKCSRQGTLPTMLTDTNWRTRRAKQENEELPDNSDFDESYEELAARKAYRHPHPGTPKTREGCIGGTWRHTKEAIGYGPGRLLWIDGIVTLYDDWTLNNEKPWSGRSVTQSHDSGMRNLNDLHRSRRFVPQRKAVPIIDRSSRWYSSNQPQPLFGTGDPPRKSAPAHKYKGFYSMAQAYS